MHDHSAMDPAPRSTKRSVDQSRDQRRSDGAVRMIKIIVTRAVLQVRIMEEVMTTATDVMSLMMIMMIELRKVRRRIRSRIGDGPRPASAAIASLALIPSSCINITVISITIEVLVPGDVLRWGGCPPRPSNVLRWGGLSPAPE